MRLCSQSSGWGCFCAERATCAWTAPTGCTVSGGGRGGAVGAHGVAQAASHPASAPQCCCTTAPWDTGTAASARRPRPSTAACGARGSAPGAWPGRPAARPRRWPPSAPRPSSTRCVEALPRPSPPPWEGAQAAEGPGPAEGAEPMSSPCPGTGGATDRARGRRHPRHHQGLQPGPARAGRAGHGPRGRSALRRGRAGVRRLQQVSGRRGAGTACGRRGWLQAQSPPPPRLVLVARPQDWGCARSRPAASDRGAWGSFMPRPGPSAPELGVEAGAAALQDPGGRAQGWPRQRPSTQAPPWADSPLGAGCSVPSQPGVQGPAPRSLAGLAGPTGQTGHCLPGQRSPESRAAPGSRGDGRLCSHKMRSGSPACGDRAQGCSD